MALQDLSDSIHRYRRQSDATAITIDSSERVGVGAAPNATFGSLLYTQGTPAANKPIISGYCRVTATTQDWRYSTTLEIVASGLMAPRCASRTYEGNSTATRPSSTLNVWRCQVSHRSAPDYLPRRRLGRSGPHTERRSITSATTGQHPHTASPVRFRVVTCCYAAGNELHA